jgi:hypothetical protein
MKLPLRQAEESVRENMPRIMTDEELEMSRRVRGLADLATAVLSRAVKDCRDPHISQENRADAYEFLFAAHRADSMGFWCEAAGVDSEWFSRQCERGIR